MPPELVDLLAAELLKVPARVWRQMFSDLLRYDDTDQLSRIKAPTLLVWGDSDPHITRDTQDPLPQAIPTADLLVYPAIGHTPRWEDPVRYSHDLATFATCLESPADRPR